MPEPTGFSDTMTEGRTAEISVRRHAEAALVIGLCLRRRYDEIMVAKNKITMLGSGKLSPVQFGFIALLVVFGGSNDFH